jgi:catechol 2,3-dioxygenase-like lactoylglutathione lyase family enzyme
MARSWHPRQRLRQRTRLPDGRPASLWQARGVTIRMGSTVVNCADIETMTDFWSEALGLVPNQREVGDVFRVLSGDRVNLSLQVASTPVSARDQMHLDLYSDDPDRQVERLVALGAVWVREENDPEDTYVVLRDPEGNEFCVCSVDSI